MGTKKAKVGIGVRLHNFTMQRLTKLCKEEGLSKAEVIREAVDRELTRRIRRNLTDSIKVVIAKH